MSSIEIIPPGGELSISPESTGFAHGYGIFETMRVRSGRLELWEAHWQRLVRSAGDLKIACAFEQDEVLHSVKVLAKDLPADAIIKLSLMKEGGASRLYIYTRALSSLPQKIGLLLDSPGCIDEASLLAAHKTHNYLENLLVLEAAHAAGCYEGLRLNSRGQITEGAISNLFFLRGGVWHTPALSCGLLPGVVREALARVVEIKEGAFTTSDLRGAEAVFLTNASVGLLPVDFLVGQKTEILLSSRKHPCFQAASRQLADFIADGAIQV